MSLGLLTGLSLSSRPRGGGGGVITNALIVNLGDSISIGAGGGGNIGALSRMTFPVGVTINNTYGVSSTALSLVNGTPLQSGFPLLNDIGGVDNQGGGVGVFPALYPSDRPTVAVVQRGTNDLGTFANANAGANGADLYRDYTRPIVRLLQAQGARVLVATILNRNDALMTPAKQTQLAAYNAAVVANAAGADGVANINTLAGMTDPNNVTNFADLLHPTPAGQILLAPAYQGAIDPLIRGRAARPPRTVNRAFGSAPTFAAGQFSLGIASGGTFIDQPTVPYDMSARPISIEFWWKPTAVTAQGIIGKLDNPSGTPQFLVGIDATGKYYMRVANSVTVTTTVTAVVNQSVYLRFIATSTDTKLEVNGANQVTTTTVVPTGGTRALKYMTPDPEHGVANASGVMSGFAAFDGDRSGVANPTDDLGLTPTAGLRGFFPFSGHLQGWNYPLALAAAVGLGLSAPQAPQQTAKAPTTSAFFDAGSFGADDMTGGFGNA
jgi:lysophospholipase L1-like esterase